MTFQRNRFGFEQDIIEISEKGLADKVSRLGKALHLSCNNLSKIHVCDIQEE